MIFPQISTKGTNFIVTQNMHSLLEHKFAPLGKYIHEKGDARCEIELEKIGEHQSGKVYRAEVNMYNNGKLFRAEATEEQMEQAIDKVRNELKHEMQHVIGKQKSLAERGRRVLKSMLRGE